MEISERRIGNFLWVGTLLLWYAIDDLWQISKFLTLMEHIKDALRKKDTLGEMCGGKFYQ